MNARLKLTSLILGAALCGWGAWGQTDRPETAAPRGGPRGPGGLPPALAVLDSDGDGALSEAEITAAPQSLKKLDRNGDRQITTEELRFGRGRGPGMRGRSAEDPRPADVAGESREPASAPKAVEADQPQERGPGRGPGLGRGPRDGRGRDGAPGGGRRFQGAPQGDERSSVAQGPGAGRGPGWGRRSGGGWGQGVPDGVPGRGRRALAGADREEGRGVGPGPRPGRGPGRPEGAPGEGRGWGRRSAVDDDTCSCCGQPLPRRRGGEGPGPRPPRG